MPEEIIGRERELAALDSFAEGVGAGPAALFITGEPGAGKTTLWRAGTRRAREHGYRVLAARPGEAETKLSFAGLADLLEDSADDTLLALPEPQRRALEVALLRRSPEGPPPDERTVAAAFLGALRVLASEGPVVVAVDDVQWLDAPSAHALTFAARRLRAEAVALLLAQRIEGAAALPFGLERAFPEERLTRIAVGPLSLGALGRLVRVRLGVSFPRPTVRRLHETSGGNPFFALELGRALVRRSGRLEPGEPLPIPDDLQELLHERLGALPRPTQEALLVAAALSHARVEVVEAAGGGDLAAALEAGVVRLDDGVVRFSHPLLASAVYSAADPARRCEVHRRLARVVPDPEERARHLARTAAGPDELVAAALEEGATHAQHRGALHAAAELAEEAHRRTPADREAVRRRLLAAARYQFAVGDPVRAQTLLDGVLAGLAPGPRRAEALLILVRIHLYEGDQAGALELAREALSQTEGDPRVRALAEEWVATVLFFLREELSTAERHARAAVELAEKVPELGPLRFTFLCTRGLVEASLGRTEARRTLEAARRIEEWSDDLRVIERADTALGFVRLWTDDLAGARASIRSVYEEALERGDESSLAMFLSHLALIEGLAGNWGEAERWAEEGYEVALETGQRPQQVFTLAARALVGAHLGRIADARADAARALEAAGERGSMAGRIVALWAVGLLELSLGNLDEVDSRLAPLAADLKRGGVCEPGQMRFLADEIEALIGLERLDDAETMLGWLEERARAIDRASALAAAARCRGLLAARRGEFEAAFRAFERALREHSRVEMPFERARTLLAHGAVARRAKRKREAREYLEEALGVFVALGAAIWADKARSELASIGGRAPSRDDLTPAESRVAALVAEGRTNREAAQALFLSERTVESHLSRIYRKLDLRSRAELARRFRG